MSGFAALLALAGCLHPMPAKAAPVRSGSGRIQLDALVKVLYTHREESEDTGVEGIDQAALRWAGLGLSGEGAAGQKDRVTWRLEVVGSAGLYRDPITSAGDMSGRAGPGEFGAVGVRQARIDYWRLQGEADRSWPVLALGVGTFMPGWGVFQDREAGAWELVDLPLIYTHPAFRGLGWQNAGAALRVWPSDLLPALREKAPGLMELGLFLVNGYFPYGQANSEPLLPGGGRDTGKGWGGRLIVRPGPLMVYGGYYQEDFEQDLKGGPDTEPQRAAAWIAGAALETPSLWAAVEWTELVVESYQLRVDGEWEDLASAGAHVSLGWWFHSDLQALMRWEWIDPNRADSSDTLEQSRFDQVAQWTVGLNYRVSPNALLMVNYVMPVEEGSRADLDRGEVGGKYQNVDNNYFRVQVQVRQ